MCNWKYRTRASPDTNRYSIFHHWLSRRRLKRHGNMLRSYESYSWLKHNWTLRTPLTRKHAECHLKYLYPYISVSPSFSIFLHLFLSCFVTCTVRIYVPISFSFSFSFPVPSLSFSPFTQRPRRSSLSGRCFDKHLPHSEPLLLVLGIPHCTRFSRKAAR